MDARRRPWLLAAALIASGCSSNDPEPCTDACEELSFDVIVSHEGSEVTITDGATIPWEYGFQGGTMIRPQIVVADGAMAGELVEVTLSHDADPADPDTLGQAADFPTFTVSEHLREEEGRLVAGPFDDQIGWTELNGTHFILGLQARAETAAGTFSAAVTVSNAEGPCDAFIPSDASGCVYADIPGVVTVTSIDDPAAGEPTCTGGRAVTLAFTAEDLDAAQSCADALPFGESVERSVTLRLADGRYPPDGCLADLGVTLGATFDAELSLISNGTCTPANFTWAMPDLAACEAACM